MSNRPHTRCPYTLKRLTDLAKLSKEHIFPDSIGGSNAFCVDTDRDENSILGDSVDAAFVGQIAICDLLTKKVRFESFEPRFRRISNVLGPNLPDPPPSGASSS